MVVGTSFPKSMTHSRFSTVYFCQNVHSRRSFDGLNSVLLLWHHDSKSSSRLEQHGIDHWHPTTKSDTYVWRPKIPKIPLYFSPNSYPVQFYYNSNYKNSSKLTKKELICKNLTTFWNQLDILRFLNYES